MNLEDVQSDVQISVINKKKLREAAKSKLTDKNLGKKGKIKLSIKSIMVGAAAIWEWAYETLPAFSEIVAGKVAGIQASFYNFIAQTFPPSTPNLAGLSIEDVYKLGLSNGGDAVVDVANSPLGEIFAAVLQFIIENPTITILGACALGGVLAYPAKKLAEVIRSKKNNKNSSEEIPKEENKSANVYTRRM